MKDLAIDIDIDIHVDIGSATRVMVTVPKSLCPVHSNVGMNLRPGGLESWRRH